MRNVFDQYSQPENRLTHALACCLSHDRSLIRPFLRWIGIPNVPPARSLYIVEQQVPGERISGEEAEERGLPDLCIYTDDGWATVFECKVQAGVNAHQLVRHVRTAASRGFPNAHAVLVCVGAPRGKLPPNVRQVCWHEIYSWLGRRATPNSWCRRMVEYMRIFEAKASISEYGIEGTLTKFDGLRFDSEQPYTAFEGRRLIRLLGDNLKRRPDLRRIGIDPKSEQRKAITGRGDDGVWDFVRLLKAKGQPHTAYPHFTLAIGKQNALAAITIPNGIKGGIRRRWIELGLDGFRDQMRQLERRLRPVIRRSKGAKPIAYVSQAHFKSQRSRSEVDGRLDVDLRTMIESGVTGVKYQPEWIDAMYALLVGKRSNIQFGLCAQFSYQCPIVRSERCIDLFADAWIAMRPLVDFTAGK